MKIDPKFQLYTVDGIFAGNAAAVYPAMYFVADLPIAYASAIVGVFLNSQIYTTGSAGWFLVAGKQGKTLAVGQSLQTIAQHVAQNPTGGSKGFSDETYSDLREFPVFVPAGGRIALYASGTAAIISAMYAIANIQIARVVP